MINFKKFLLSEGKLGLGDPKEHLTHIEDLVIEEGPAGMVKLKQAVAGILSFAKGIDNGDAEVNLKVDGAPALYFGADPRKEFKGQFFVATKHNLQRKDQIMNHSVQEIQQNHPREEQQGLVVKLSEALEKLQPLYESIKGSIGNRIVQTDMLFGNSGEKSEEIIDGQNYLTFNPQLIKYAVPVDPNDSLYNNVASADFGIGIHDTWKGSIETVNDPRTGEKYPHVFLRQSNKKAIEKIVEAASKFNVFAINGNFDPKSTGMTMDSSKADEINSLIEMADEELNKVSTGTHQTLYGDGRHDFVSKVMVFINGEVRKHAQKNVNNFYTAAYRGHEYNDKYLRQSFLEFLTTQLDRDMKGKGEKGQQNARNRFELRQELFETFQPYFKCMYYLIQMKRKLEELFDQIDSTLKIGKSFYEQEDGSYEYDPQGEGFAVFNGRDNHVKIVKRLDFSGRNLIKPKFGK